MTFWNPGRGCLADDTTHNHFSEHSQSLALICGLGSHSQKKAMLRALTSQELYRTTIYYSFYLFEVLLKNGYYDLFAKRMEHWHNHLSLGCRTTLETPEPSRSDCHAWGSHPIYHFYSSLLGIRPASFGFKTVSITPCMGSLTEISGSMPHPKGKITVSLRRMGHSIEVAVELPKDVAGVYFWGASVRKLHSGKQRFHISHQL